MYEVTLSDQAKKDFKKLDKKLQIRIVKTLERIRIRPEIHIKKLVGDKAYRLRVGDYRVILDINKGKLIILVIRINHRRKIYNLLK
tara:strand:- start:1378 stop:1635 length:258 start_codon:yes stop_codon:yes gene_type:complete